jgi:hypothetical protein
LDFLTFSSRGFSIFVFGAVVLLRAFSDFAGDLPVFELAPFDPVLLTVAVDFLVFSTFAFFAELVLAFLVVLAFLSVSFFFS